MNDSRETRLAALFEWLEIEDAPDRALLEDLHDWLASEAVTAGGLGPGEANKIWERHIGDSLTFLKAIPEPVEVIADIGSGVGLPGVPIAIALPGTRVMMLDRSQRRTLLIRRIVRILGLVNTEVVTADLRSFRGTADAVVSRASLPPLDLVAASIRAFPSASVAIVAASRSQAPPLLEDADIVEIPGHVLGGPSWLYRFSLSS